MEHFDSVFKLDLTEETRTRLQEEEAIASSSLRSYTLSHKKPSIEVIYWYILA